MTIKSLGIPLICVISVCLSSCSSYLNLTVEEQLDYRLEPYNIRALNDTKNELYAINHSHIQAILANMEPHKELLVILFTSWCPNFNERKQELLALKGNEKYQTLFITPDDYIYQGRYNKVLRDSLDSDICMIDMDEYLAFKQLHKRQEFFVSQFCKSCADKTGFPVLISLSAQGEITYNKLLIEGVDLSID